MRHRYLYPFRAFFVCATLSFVAGCGDDVMQQPSYSPVDSGQPPAAPTNAAMPHGSGATFAVSKLILGRNDPNGFANKDRWKTIGYNLDHTFTTKSTTSGVIINENVCTRVDGAGFDMVADGHDGRDNGFGATVMSLILAVNGDTEKATNTLILLGKHTLIVDVQGLGEAQTYQSLTARIYEARSFVDAQGMPVMPAFDGTDVWPVASESVIKGDVESPISMTKDAYVAEEGNGGTFVGQFGESIVLALDALGLPEEKGVMQLRIHDPLVTMRLSADRASVEIGTIAGYIDIAEIDAQVRRLVGVVDASLCNSATSTSVGQQIRQGADILRNGQKDKTKTCDSISIGIQFEAARAHLGPVAAPATLPPNPCAAP